MDSLERGGKAVLVFSRCKQSEGFISLFCMAKESRGSGNIYTKTDNKIMNDDDVDQRSAWMVC